MKKTLLIAAAALAAGMLSVQAQSNVYSQNVVGYVNITVPNNKYVILANQLNTGSNTLNNVISAGAVDSDTTILYFKDGVFKQFIYYDAINGNSPDGNAGWYDLLANTPCTNTLSPGDAVFVHNSSGAAINLSTVGSVQTGTNLITIPTGYSMRSFPMPVGGTSIDNLGFVGVDSQDYLLMWNGTSYDQYIYYDAVNGNSPDGNAGWYGLLSNIPMNTNSAAWPKVGNGFFINHVAPSQTWTNIAVIP